ncbi:bifunctional UDP-N-acetylmuramoyl-tripeptide:D-alanyl-D-alanine ligase/alanine racemase [Saprospiraceae bacterium]|nr:bifunctional UDP-N-acetylmuramoyl-tripeptide:D-alanyl-D-alanine ligase/alanine racemase [Saprospiraceae bacterium]
MSILLSTIIDDSQANVITAASLSFDNIVVKEFIFDTRKVVEVSDALFLCLAKNHKDILHHISKAEAKGIHIFLVPKGISLPESKSIFLEVNDVISSIQEIATKHRDRHSVKVIGITGSNGKTIIKEWLAQLLEIQFDITKSPASFNSQLGVPLSVLLLNQNTDFGIFEAGISQPKEMAKLQPIINCSLGILTNIGDAHDIGFKNQDQKLVEKLQLFSESNQLIFEETTTIDKKKISNHCAAELISWSTANNDTDYTIEVDKNQDFVLLHIAGKHKLSAIFYLTDKASIKNVIHVIIAGLELGLHSSYIIDRVKFLEAVSMRLVMKKALRNCIVIDDSYNADLTSLENALDFAKEQKKKRLLHLILTEFDQIKQDEQYYQRLGEIINKHSVDKISYIGATKPVLIHSEKINYFRTSQELQQQVKDNPPENETLLLKGARRFQLDNIIADLHAKSHRTEFVIDLNAISNNVKAYRDIIGPEVKIMAVIKAGAYGSDSISLAKHLLRCGVEYLAVAYYDEAIELRKEGISSPIMIMNPDPSLTYIAEQYDLELEIYSNDQLRSILKSTKHHLKLHLKIDSGMHRLGFRKEDKDELLLILNNENRVDVKSIFSHFSSAEDEKEDHFTQDQHIYFDELSKLLLESNTPAINPEKVWRHICNSHAAVRFPKFHYGMVRLGIGLYGYLSDPAFELAHTLKTYVAQVKQINAGDSVGYNRNFIANRPMQIATLCIGYADGLSRKIGNGKTHFFIQGMEVETVGNISMDTCSVNITGMNVNSGDEVIIYNSRKTFNDLASLSEKSPYEMISGIGQRVVRTYIKE